MSVGEASNQKWGRDQGMGIIGGVGQQLFGGQPVRPKKIKKS